MPKSTIDKFRENQKQIEKVIIKERVFDEIFKKSRKNSAAVKNQLYPNWKKTITYSNGLTAIRCQANVSKKGTKQCMTRSVTSTLFCRHHGSKSVMAKKEVQEIKRELGIYSGNGITALQQELKEIENLSPEQLQDTTDELKLSIALLRRYLKDTDDAKISKSPGQLMWIIGEIARLKKEHYEIKHSKNVSFTKEQILYMFNQFYLVLISSIKDTNLLENISVQIEEIGKQIGKNGFREVS